MNQEDKQIPSGFLTSGWINFAALGFGTGLSPWMPGTMGTIAGIPLAWGLTLLARPLAIGLLALLTVLGIFICGQAADALGEHDHRAIVWDEIIGFAWVMIFLPWNWINVLLAFIAFRFFDILKPWPIAWLDQYVVGGFGIMVDDLLAAVYAWVVIVLGQNWVF